MNEPKPKSRFVIDHKGLDFEHFVVYCSYSDLPLLSNYGRFFPIPNQSGFEFYLDKRYDGREIILYLESLE